jgi:hypothetical protein
MFHDNPNITPEQIKNLVLMLAYDINIEHKFSESGAHINLMDFVNVIGIPLPQEVIDKLKTRNIVKLSQTGISTGAFVNNGEAISAPTNKGVTIIIPAQISGTYETGYESFSIKFNSEATISGKKFLLTAGLDSIVADNTHLSIKVGGFLSSLLSRNITF